MSRRAASLLVLSLASLPLVLGTRGASAQSPAESGGPSSPAAPAAPASSTSGHSDAVEAGVPFQLSPQEQERVASILKFWEYRSSRVKTFRCSLTRWEYDPVFGPAGEAKTQSQGSIKYAAPDKGLLRIDSIGHYTPGAKPGDPPTYTRRPDDYGEHWVCDGEAVFEFNAQKKTLIETRLPEEMRGQAIADGPLPFLFGAKAEKLQQRYWIRELTPPPEAKGEYWLEVYPKVRGDAANYQRVQLILDEKEFLPIAMQLYLPNGKSRVVYQFSERKVNDFVDDLRRFTNSFIRPDVPRGWTKVVENIDEPMASAPTAPSAGQAQRPASRPPR